jgi:hypothetical protein
VKKSEINEFNKNTRFNTFLTKELAECTTEAEREVVKAAMRNNIATGAKMLDNEERRKRKLIKQSGKKTRKWKKYSDEIREEVIRVLNSPNPPTQCELSKKIGIQQRRLSRWWMEAVRKGEVEYKPRKIGRRKKEEYTMEKEQFDRSVLEFVNDGAPVTEQLVLTEEELLLLWCNFETSLKPEFIEKADNIFTGKILKRLYEKYGGDQAASHVAREKGWC